MVEGTRYIRTVVVPAVESTLEIRWNARLSQLKPSKYIGLQILEKLVQTKWKMLPEGQRQGELSFSYLAKRN